MYQEDKIDGSICWHFCFLKDLNLKLDINQQIINSLLAVYFKLFLEIDEETEIALE